MKAISVAAKKLQLLKQKIERISKIYLRFKVKRSYQILSQALVRRILAVIVVVARIVHHRTRMKTFKKKTKTGNSNDK